MDLTQNYHRRHSRWYEVIIFNFWFQIVIGFLLIVLLPQWLRYGGLVDEDSLQANDENNFEKQVLPKIFIASKALV
ncbi:hypothetical protein DC080_06820 [Ignatzschineria cameli]|nr:hypothetical protein DC080_06820 [Ignatzschineria cameli]